MKSHAKLPEKIVLVFMASVWGVVCLFPVRHVFSATFSTDSGNMTRTIFPNSIGNGLLKLKTALSTVNMAKATFETLGYTLLAIVGMLLICSLASYEFTFFNFPFKKVLFGLVMGSMMLPFVLYVIPLCIQHQPCRYAVGGVALPLMVSLLSVFIMMQFCEDLPPSFIEAASIDGAGHFAIFRLVVFPLMRNGFITATVLMFLHSWGGFPVAGAGGGLQRDAGQQGDFQPAQPQLLCGCPGKDGRHAHCHGAAPCDLSAVPALYYTGNGYVRCKGLTTAAKNMPRRALTAGAYLVL